MHGVASSPRGDGCKGGGCEVLAGWAGDARGSVHRCQGGRRLSSLVSEFALMQYDAGSPVALASGADDVCRVRPATVSRVGRCTAQRSGGARREHTTSAGRTAAERMRTGAFAGAHPSNPITCAPTFSCPLIHNGLCTLRYGINTQCGCEHSGGR